MKRSLLIATLCISCVATSALTALAVGALSSSRSATLSSVSTSLDDSYKFASDPQIPVALPDLTSAAEKAVGSVVNIENIRKVAVGSFGGGNMMDPFEFFFGPQGRNQQQQQQQPQTREARSGGSGVVLSSDGYIVTNNHVIDGADQINVTLSDGRSLPAKLIGTDPGTDIALIKIEATDLPVLEFGNSEDLRLGQWLLAVGNPMGLNNTVTAGIVSATGRSLGAGNGAMLDIESFIQTDAVVNPGNSGGALVTTNGQLVGINTILKSNTGTYIGYSFAVPSSIVRKIVADLKQYGTVQRAVLGIKYSEITPQWAEQFAKELGIKETEGLYVGEVINDGAAAEAGIKKGDVITQLNDKPVRTSSMLQENLAKLRPGDKIKVSVKRDGSVKQFDITLRNRAGKAELLDKNSVDVTKLLGGRFQVPNDQTFKKLGIRNGIQVVEITPSGLLAKSRVRTGFIITHINGVAISNPDDLNRLTDKIESLDGIYPDGKQVMYQVINN